MEAGKELIVGAAGFLGRSLAKALLAENRHVVLAARKDPEIIGTETIIGDLLDKAYCEQLVASADVVYFLAGYKKNIAMHTSRPFETYLGNVLPLENFLAAARGSRIRMIVYVSSSLVAYAGEESSSVDGYVLGKHANELALKAFARETGIDVKIVRSAPIYGVGDNFDSDTANFIPALIRRIDKAENELSVWGSGHRELQFIYVDDLARNLIAATSAPSIHFEFGHPESITVNEVVDRLLSIMDKKLTVVHDMTKPDKETRLFRFHNLADPGTRFDEGLQKTVAYYKEFIREHG